MKKAFLILSSCIILAGMFCGYNINHSQREKSIPSKKIDADSEQFEAVREKTSANITTTGTADAQTYSTKSTDTPIFAPYDLPAIKQGEKSQEAIWTNPLLGQLDFNNDGVIDKNDFQLSEMSRQAFAEKLVENGNVGTPEEAQWLIDGDIASSCGIMY